MPFDSVDTHLADSFNKGIEVIGVEAWIEASYTVNVAYKLVVFNLSGVAKLGFELIISA